MMPSDVSKGESRGRAEASASKAKRRRRTPSSEQTERNRRNRKGVEALFTLDSESEPEPEYEPLHKTAKKQKTRHSHTGSSIRRRRSFSEAENAPASSDEDEDETIKGRNRRRESLFSDKQYGSLLYILKDIQKRLSKIEDKLEKNSTLGRDDDDDDDDDDDGGGGGIGIEERTTNPRRLQGAVKRKRVTRRGVPIRFLTKRGTTLTLGQTVAKGQLADHVNKEMDAGAGITSATDLHDLEALHDQRLGDYEAAGVSDPILSPPDFNKTVMASVNQAHCNNAVERFFYLDLEEVKETATPDVYTINGVKFSRADVHALAQERWRAWRKRWDKTDRGDGQKANEKNAKKNRIYSRQKELAKSRRAAGGMCKDILGFNPSMFVETDCMSEEHTDDPEVFSDAEPEGEVKTLRVVHLECISREVRAIYDFLSHLYLRSHKTRRPRHIRKESKLEVKSFPTTTLYPAMLNVEWYDELDGQEKKLIHQYKMNPEGYDKKAMIEFMKKGKYKIFAADSRSSDDSTSTTSSSSSSSDSEGMDMEPQTGAWIEEIEETGPEEV